MSHLKLHQPTKDDKDLINEYKKEFIYSQDSMDGTGELGSFSSFEDWYAALIDNSKEETVRKGRVPATTYMAFDEETNYFVGMISIRKYLNEYLSNYGGHIGYSVRKSERGKGYATEMLKLALIKCINLGLEKVLVTCDINNGASAKVIIKNGGFLENEVPEDNSITKRYWINLK